MPFEIVVADVVEAAVPGETPIEMARRLALEKARAVADRQPDALVLGADTIVVDGATVLGKPADPVEATGMLVRLRGRTHRVISGVALIEPRRARPRRRVAISAVEMRQLTDEEVARYVASGDPLDKAGAYAIQNEPFRLVARHDGCFCNIVGLPLGEVDRLLRAAGLTPPIPPDQACPYRLFTAACQRPIKFRRPE